MSAKASIVHQTLTNYARGVAVDKTSALAAFLAPVCPTGVTNGQYKEFKDKNAFAVYKTARAVGGPRRRVEFDANDAYYNCKPNGLEIAIDDHERHQAGNNDTSGLDLEQAKINTLLSATLISHEHDVFAKARAFMAAAAGIGVWSNAATEVVDEIDGVIEGISNEIAMMPNRMILGLGAWRVLKNHPKIKERINGLTTSASLEVLAGMLLNPGMEIRVGVLPFDENKAGKVDSKKNIVGAECWIFYGADSPSLYDPSFMKTFRINGSGVDSVKQYRDESHVSDMYALDWTEDVKVTAPIAGKRIVLS